MNNKIALGVASIAYLDHFYPAAGVIDRVMREFKGKRFGFDVMGTPI